MINNTKLPKLHISWLIYKISEKIVRKNAAEFQAPLSWTDKFVCIDISMYLVTSPFCIGTDLVFLGLNGVGIPQET